MGHSQKNRERRSRVQVQLSRPLDSRLGSYALAASAASIASLIIAIPAEAAPVCKSLSAVLDYSGTYAFSPAGQRVPQFNIAQSYETFSTHTSTGSNAGFFARNLPRAEAAISSSGFVAALPAGANIGPSGKFGKGVGYGLIFTFTPYKGATSQHHAGNLRFGQPNLLGYRFLIEGQLHYGWVRLQSNIVKGIRTPHISTQIMGYGYEMSPNTAIKAGSCAAEGTAALRESVPSQAAGSLGALALGADGIPIWRQK